MFMEKPTVKLIGEDGNAFAIMGTVAKSFAKSRIFRRAYRQILRGVLLRRLRQPHKSSDEVRKHLLNIVMPKIDNIRNWTDGAASKRGEGIRPSQGV